MDTEVSVDIVDNKDPVEVAVAEELSTPSVQEETPTTPTEKEETPPEPVKAEEPAPDAAKQYQEEIDRIKADHNRTGYALREAKNQLEFLTKQLNEVRAQQVKRESIEQGDRELKSIEHLRDIDPPAYFEAREKILLERVRKEVEEAKSAFKVNNEANEHLSYVNQVNAKLTRDYPDVQDMNSDLFKEAQAELYRRYPDENQRAWLIQNDPNRFYDIVSLVNANLEVRKLKAQKADTSRESRVAQQGAVKAQPKVSATAGVSLTKEQLKFCKDNNFDPKEYAKFVGAGRK